MAGRIVESLPFCTALLFEPGQALCAPHDTGSYDHSMAFSFARGGGKRRTLSD